MRIVLGVALMAAALAAAPARATSSLLDYVGECVPFARIASGIQLYGNAWTWWDSADGVYARGQRPREGAVLVFRQSERLRLGHVAVVSRVLTPRVVMVTHANWSRLNGARGHVERDVTLTDVSERGDWTRVKVWYRDSDGLGGSIYPVYGFIYATPATDAVPRPKPSAELTAQDPDYIGTLIHAGY